MSAASHPSPVEPHYISVLSVKKQVRNLLHAKAAAGKGTRLSKAEIQAVADALNNDEKQKTHNGVNFSRIQPDTVFQLEQSGLMVEFETLGPYLADYIDGCGHVTAHNITAEDAIGLQLSILLRQLFPAGRLVSLYDDYNAGKVNQGINDTTVYSFSDTDKQRFRDSLTRLFKDAGVIQPGHHDIKDYLLISEAAKLDEADALVSTLEKRGYIHRDGEAITFVNDDAENPLHRRIQLRTKNGRWLCQALDAATFYGDENLARVHILALPDYMRDQQDKVWEILRVLGMQPSRYHNIFFDPSRPIAEIVETVAAVFIAAKERVGQPA